MKISEHIKSLLFEHECVIIPGFGGFVGRYQEAKVDFSTSKLHPPVKLIAFNQSLQENDALLINRISKTESLSYNEAENKIADYVSKVNAALKTGKKVKLPDIGTFSIHKGKLLFDPENSINFHAEAFGLETFEFPMLQTTGKQKAVQKKQLEPVKSKKRRPALVPLLVGIPLVTAMSYMPVFFQSNERFTPEETAGISIPLKIETREAKMTELSIPKKTLELKEKITTEIKTPVQTNTVNSQTSVQAYIIAGSFSSYENAEKAVNDYKNRGYSAVILPASQGMNRVAVKSYNDINTAYAELNNLRQALNNEGLWILQN